MNNNNNSVVLFLTDRVIESYLPGSRVVSTRLGQRVGPGRNSLLLDPSYLHPDLQSSRP